MEKRLDQFGVAAALQEIAALLELKGGKDRFKARAYHAGARIIAGLTEDLDSLVDQNKLTTKRGIGDALASQIKQLHLTGTSSVLSQLREQFPPGILELSTVPGLSINKIRELHNALGITSTAELKTAAESGRIREVKGFGSKSEEKLLESLAKKSTPEQRRLHIHHAQRIGVQLMDYLKTEKSVLKMSLAGSIRRWLETVGTIRIVASAPEPSRVIDHFLRFPLITQVEDRDTESCIVDLAEGARVSLRVAKPDEYVWTLWRETGTDAHFEKLQHVLNGKISASAKPGRARAQEPSEEDLYEALGMQYIAPELREDTGEIEAAMAGKLPGPLIDLGDIKGMVHCHTTYSDGRNTVAEMALAADAMGMKYITITDHSPTAFYANGVNLDRLKRQWDEIDEVQEHVKVKLLKGTESDIIADGSLDYPDRILEKFDVIVASIHSRYKMDSEKMTRRVITAMRQPVFKIWGHALGRLIQRRPPFECDMERVLDTIAESRAAVEINGDPFRLDMEPRWIREARKRKVKFVISVDAHSTGALQNVKFGVGMARRGWVQKSEVLNALGLKAFTNAVRP
jgi:DNA polymerase (family X)